MHIGVMFFLISTALTLTPKQSAEVQKIEKSLVAPCCYTQSIADHMSDVAEQMRQEVTNMVAAGESQQEILEHYKALYGNEVLIVPDGATGKVAFFVPLLVFALSTVAVFGILRKMSRPMVASGHTVPQPVDADLAAIRQRIDAEVKEFF